MCSFNSASFPESLAIASDDGMMIGTIDDIQKLHIHSVPLGEQVLASDINVLASDVIVPPASNSISHTRAVP